MIRRFPYEAAFLARTKLRYVNLPSVLNDGKVDRSARVPAFVAIYLGTETGLIFLENGEAVAAALVDRRARHPAAVAEVIERGQMDSERAEVGYYRAAEGQLRAMWASLASAPLMEAEAEALQSPERLLEWARGRGLEGVLEVIAGDAAHYVVFEEGAPVEAFLAGRAGGEPGSRDLGQLLARPSGAPVAARAFAAVPRIPPQASPALFALYEKTGSAALAVISEMLGSRVALETLETARQRVRARYPFLDGFQLEEGRLRARPRAVAADELTTGAAAWLFEAISTAAHARGEEPMDVMRRVVEDQRYALKAQGFFARLPWPIIY